MVLENAHKRIMQNRRKRMLCVDPGSIGSFEKPANFANSQRHRGLNKKPSMRTIDSL